MGRIWNEFVAKCKANGKHSEWDIAHESGAAEAWRRDQEAQEAGLYSMTQDQWTATRPKNADGSLKGFETQSDWLQAINDPLYHKSEAYRQHVAAVTAATDPAILGVAGHVIGSDGSTVQVGRDGLSEAATVEGMLRNARRDAVLEHLRTFNINTAKGRLERLEYLTNPANAAILAEIDELTSTPEDRTRRALLDMQEQAGGALRYQMGAEEAGTLAPNAKDIDYARGTYADGSPIKDSAVVVNQYEKSGFNGSIQTGGSEGQ